MSENNNNVSAPALAIRLNEPIELSLAEQQRLTLLLAHCVKPGAITIDALLTIQQSRGWISDQTLQAIASFIGVSTADLDSVATFYNLIFRQPIANVVLHPCNGMACQLMGSETIEHEISRCLGIKPGQSDSDNQFTLIPLPCLGACDKAPVMIAAQTLFERLTTDGIGAILTQLINRGPDHE